ncbi:hypothetical protein FRACYDRAFT_251120 [Fragilariopsis cylindrus CCMP1102]|uniref:Uncharacterized protein n=1 Tax=Fragilariopsis cylindrus CCMP1102 TaxID=635003 RepID=A0A1E7ENC4_9STRA|nr:hypothetical protein FRACYDRAFT_251120 [Fragilariopsis cylindrus CCMP1102]|eukprot:OEU07316.1 hypothetical protein FRACYDRAFT_251120 [Fragilariopsis cylindrus CCMP1102]
MTIRNNNSNDKLFASQAPTEETDDAVVAFNVNAVDVFNEDIIPFAHASSEVELSSISGGGGLSTSTTAANSGGLYGQLNTTTNAVAAPTTPIAYSTGKPPQPPPPSQQPQPRFSSSIAVTTGAPIPTPTSTTQTISTSSTTATRGNSRRNNNNSQNCCSGLTCCGITAIVLSSICVCCIVPTILIFWAIGSAVNNGATIGSF